ncbi:hypothetical protein M378DRAFT_12818 [Amanita muscaria Koide BX008]|uniref:Uncharacterized protein n=1 Tax=Amanita muscaria (strain Koide BX008) TaxID=946122 RepID=A0A0C2SH81_AMAMK|nr:hypothetical protein M378DRAFT_12818 [Amanita muscaria Koide BX008]
MLPSQFASSTPLEATPIATPEILILQTETTLQTIFRSKLGLWVDNAPNAAVGCFEAIPAGAASCSADKFHVQIGSSKESMHDIAKHTEDKFDASRPLETDAFSSEDIDELANISFGPFLYASTIV